MREPSSVMLGVVLLSAGLLLRCGGDEVDDDATTGGSAGLGGAGKGGTAGSAGAGKAGTAGSGQGAGRGGSAGKGAGGDTASGGTDARVCTPGETQACVGPAACQGGQVCRDDGSGWGTCNCGDTGGSGSGSAGEGGEGGKGDAGSAGSGGAGAGGDAGAGGEAGAVPVCDLVEQAGCQPGERCTVVSPEPPAVDELACVADGSEPEGSSCTRGSDGADDCVAGSGCSSSITGSICRPYCDPESPTTCATTCLAYESGYGLCEPACDLVAQECPGELACVYTAGNVPLCVTHQDTAVGSPCNFVNSCVEGAICAFTLEIGGGNVCTAVCDATQGSSCTNPEDACIPLQFLAPSENDTGNAGTCLPCSRFGAAFQNCSLLLAGACDDEPDCDPLSTEAALEFTCDLPSGSCVLAD